MSYRTVPTRALLLASATVIIFNLVADVTYGYIDPRIREA